MLHSGDTVGRHMVPEHAPTWCAVRSRSVRIGVLIAVGIFGTPPIAPAQTHEAQPSTPLAHTQPAERAGETLFPSRDASGTGWLPDLTPMYGFHHQTLGWDVMLHANLFAQYLQESGTEHRRSKQAGSINWLMAMARRPLRGGRLGVRTMISLEPWTISGCGYPDLLATGEICNGDSINDRQHPHDLFMELAAEYDRPLTKSMRWQVYGGLAGEPAIGPPGFPHRLSALPNPIAPISHHWLDATHIAFGVPAIVSSIG